MIYRDNIPYHVIVIAYEMIVIEMMHSSMADWMAFVATLMQTISFCYDIVRCYGFWSWIAMLC